MANTINKKKQETSRNSISHGKSNGFTRTNTFGQGPLENINIDFDTFSRLEVISGFFFSNQNFGEMLIRKKHLKKPMEHLFLENL